MRVFARVASTGLRTAGMTGRKWKLELIEKHNSEWNDLIIFVRILDSRSKDRGNDCMADFGALFL